MNRLFLSKKYSDITFIVEGETIPAHKNILAVSCVYFETMLFGATNEANMKTIVLKQTPVKLFKEVLRAVYMREVDILDWTAEEVLQLVSLGDEYQFPKFLKRVARKLKPGQIDENNVSVMYEMAKSAGCKLLQRKCLDFGETHSDYIVPDTKVFSKLSSSYIVGLLESDSLVATEKDILQAVSLWRGTDFVDEKKLLYSRIRWRSLPQEYAETILFRLLTEGENSLHSSWYDDPQAGAEQKYGLLRAESILCVEDTWTGECWSTKEKCDLLCQRGVKRNISTLYGTITVTLKRPLELNRVQIRVARGCHSVWIDVDGLEFTQTGYVLSDESTFEDDTYEQSFEKDHVERIKISLKSLNYSFTCWNLRAFLSE